MKTGLLKTLGKSGLSLVLLLALLPAQRAAGAPAGIGGGPTFVEPNPNLQYHIQTDQGPERFFRFQTLSGQFRKENRHADGSVTGAYGWVDPNGVLRLFDYISDDGGYRIAQQRQFKVGKHVAGGRFLETNAGPLELGFEVFPLDVASDPAFNEVGARAAFVGGGAPLIGQSGFRAVNTVDGQFHVTPSFQVDSLVSTNDDASNPVSKHAHATGFTTDPFPVYPAGPPVAVVPIARRKPIVIGVEHSEPKRKPAPRRKGIVIGHTGDNRTVQRNISSSSGRRTPAVVVGRAASAAPSSPRKNPPIVIGISNH